MSQPVHKDVSVEKGASMSGAVERAPGFWASVKPKHTTKVSVMDPDIVKIKWNALYAAAGKRGPDETWKAMFRIAVYAYCAKNGSTRAADYSGKLELADGTEVAAAIIPRIVEAQRVRRFLRGNMDEAYTSLKESGVCAEDALMVSKAAALGISADCAFAMADFLTDCPLFTPAESKAHDHAFAHATERARRARGGRTLESVENEGRKAALRTQGPMDEDSDSF